MPNTDPALRFRKSSYSNAKQENCVEVADLPGAAAVRDSRYPEHGHIVVPAREMAALLGSVRSGHL